ENGEAIAELFAATDQGGLSCADLVWSERLASRPCGRQGRSRFHGSVATRRPSGRGPRLIPDEVRYRDDAHLGSAVQGGQAPELPRWCPLAGQVADGDWVERRAGACGPVRAAERGEDARSGGWQLRGLDGGLDQRRSTDRVGQHLRDEARLA